MDVSTENAEPAAPKYQNGDSDLDDGPANALPSTSESERDEAVSGDDVASPVVLVPLDGLDEILLHPFTGTSPLTHAVRGYADSNHTPSTYPHHNEPSGVTVDRELDAILSGGI
jgi:hypothetical protein